MCVYVCVWLCVCVCGGKKCAFVVHCDVSGSSSFEELLRFLDGVDWGLLNLTKAGGTTQCVCRAVFRTVSTGQDIHRFYQISWLKMAIFWICIYKVIFILVIMSAFCLISISILSISMFTRIPAALFAVSNISATYFFCIITHKTIYVFN